MCASRKRVVFPFAPVDLVHQQHVADGGFPRPQQIRVVVVVSLSAFVEWCEWCNCDCDERGKNLVVVTNTAGSHRPVVMPEVCASV